MQQEVDVWKPSPGMGNRIRLARQALNLTQEEVATALGVGKAAVARWEGATRVPGGEHLLPLAKVLQVPVEWLIGGRGLPPEPPERAQAREVQDRVIRLKQVLMAAESLEGIAERSCVSLFTLQQAKDGNCRITIDETVRIAQALGISVSWLLYGKHGAEFAASDGPHPNFSGIERSSTSDYPGYLGNRQAGDRFERLRFLINSQPSLKGLARRSGVPETVLRAFLQEEEPLRLEDIAKIVPACKSSLKWILIGDETSLGERVEDAFDEVVRGLRDILQEGLDAWWRERQKQGWAKGVLSYLRLKPLIEMYPDKGNLLQLNATDLETELSKRLNPPPLQALGRLDWESIPPTYGLLALAGWDHRNQPLPLELFRMSYQHILDRSLSGLTPDEGFIREVASQLDEIPWPSREQD